MSFFSQLLQFQDALCLDLEQGFVGQQTNIIHSLGVGDTQSRPLPTSQEENSYFVLRNLVET